jgi:DNA-binding LacI/PurR family transcriptional regulator
MGDNMRGLLEQTGIKYPDDVGLITLCYEATDPEIAGVDQQEELVGEAAVEQLVQLLYYHKAGIPEIPRTLLISPSWVDGPSLPRHSGSAKK